MISTLRRSDTPELAELYDICPTSFVLPADYGMFVEEFKRSKGNMWIMKPVGSAQGKGIFIFTKLSEISDWKKDYKWKSDEPQAAAYIVQRYINNPYLIGGKKFDMRIYALVTSFNPLNVWLYRTGFCRFTNQRYSKETVTSSNLFMHLTNVAIQKQAADYDKETDAKLDMQSLKVFLTSKVGLEATEKLFYNMHDIIIRSLLSVQKVMINDKHCFELYGYDIIIDENMKPWLLEVNASPSLTASSTRDYDLKVGMLNDAFTIVDMEGNLEGDEMQVGGFDMIWQNGYPIKQSQDGYPTSPLGCYNDRANNLKTLKERKKDRTGTLSGAGGSSKNVKVK
jgi:tubulin polyglutamylase TTLL9